MKKIVCDLCGESDFLKVNGLFECQVCGAKYTIAEARNMFVDVDDTPVVRKQTNPHSEAPRPVEATGQEHFDDEEDVPAARQAQPTVSNRPMPTSVARPGVGTPQQNSGVSTVKRIVSNVQQTAQMRTSSAESKPKTVIKKVVVRPVEIPKVKPVVQQPKEVKPGQKATNGLTVETNQLIQNYFILAQSAYDSKNFADAENYANRVIEIDPANCDAWLLKGNCAGWQTTTPQFRLLESINCWNTCIQNSPENEKEDYLFTVRTNCIEVAIAYAMRQIQGYKTNPSEEAFNVIRDTVDYLEPMIKKANQTFGLDVVTYEDKLASNINLVIEETSKAAIIKFGKKKEQQSDKAFLAFIEVQNQNIIVWDYLMDIAKRHGTVSALLKDIVKMHETIIRSCGWKLSGNKFKESYRIPHGEKLQRLDKINKAKKKLEDKFVDIRKRDRAFQKIKNAEYWENHQEEKQQLLEERATLDHEIFELENSKLKMPILSELRKLEEECIRLNVLKDNPTYTNKERTAFMEQMNKTRKVIVSKKREIASIIDPIDKKIEDMKRRMVTIDAELNMNR